MKMRYYFLKVIALGIFFLIILVSLMLITSAIIKKRGFTNDSTISNTLVFGENEHYDLMFSGTSHARMFSWRRNHKIVESILQKNVINIGQGGAICGVNEQFFYLKYFIKRHNTVDQLIYFLSPPMLYSEILPVASNTFNEEPFSFKFLFEYLRFESENKPVRILDYCRSKLMPYWITLKPHTGYDPILDATADPDTTGLIEFIHKYYDPRDIERFKKSCNTVEKEIQYTKEHGIEMIFVLAPTLFGQWPGQNRTIEFAKEMNKKYGIKYYDLTEVMMDPKYFYDHQHLNSAGVKYFTRNYLKPIVYHDTAKLKKLLQNIPPAN